MIVCAAANESAGLDLPIHVLGVGKTASACSLTRLLCARKPKLVLLFGICGAYSSLQVGELCIVTADVFADEGVWTETGFLTLQDLGLAIPESYHGDKHWSQVAQQMLHAPYVSGATVSTCSGTNELAATIAKRTKAHIETMEGAAVAYVCQQFNIPLLHIRCVSNLTGDRAQANWNLLGAIHKVQNALLTLLPALMEPN